MKNPPFLPWLMVRLTGVSRQKILPNIDFTWSQNCWTHNVFRVYELVFGRRVGIRWEGTSYLNEDGGTVQISGTFENFLAVFEGAVRAYFKSWNLGWRIVYVPQFAGIPMGFQSPFMFAIAFDAVVTFDGGGSFASSFTYSHTCTGSNLTLISEGYFNAGGAPTVTSVTYNSVALTNGKTLIAGNQNTFIYYLAAPSTGSNSILLTPSKSCLGSFGSMSFTGTSATPAGASAQNSNVGSTTPNTSITTTAANSWVVDFIQLDGTTAALTATTTGSGQTSRYTSSAFGPANQSIGGSSMTTTSIGTYAPAWSLLLSTDWQSVSLEIVALVSSIVISITDSLTISEALVELLTSFISKSDSVSLVDSPTTSITSFINKSDSVSLSESVSMTLVSLINSSDSISLTESLSMLETSFINKTDSVSLSESVTMLETSFINVTDSVSLTESITVSIAAVGAISISVTDSVSLTESISRLLSISLTVSDSLTTGESLTMLETSFINKSDSISLTESVSLLVFQNLSINITDSVSLTESVTLTNSQLGGIAVNDSISITESRTVSVSTGFRTNAYDRMFSNQQTFPLGMDDDTIL